MRILYGVQGTGNGHISRCRSVAEALARKGVEVDYLLSGRPANGYFDMQAFGHYRAVPAVMVNWCCGRPSGRTSRAASGRI